jgi:hypothetical protein
MKIGLLIKTCGIYRPLHRILHRLLSQMVLSDIYVLKQKADKRGHLQLTNLFLVPVNVLYVTVTST